MVSFDDLFRQDLKHSPPIREELQKGENKWGGIPRRLAAGHSKFLAKDISQSILRLDHGPTSLIWQGAVLAFCWNSAVPSTPPPLEHTSFQIVWNEQRLRQAMLPSYLKPLRPFNTCKVCQRRPWFSHLMIALPLGSPGQMLKKTWQQNSTETGLNLTQIIFLIFLQIFQIPL